MSQGKVKYKPSEEVDFVIVGSGASGGVLAKELSTNGFRVVVLEQGPYLQEKDFTHDEIKVFAEHELTNQPKLQPATFRKTTTDTAKTQPCVMYGRCVGGSSVHFTANYWRLHEIDFIEHGKDRRHCRGELRQLADHAMPTSSLITRKWNGKLASPVLPAPARSIRRVPSRIRCRRCR